MDIEIAFFGGSFTGLDLDLQKRYLDMAAHYVFKHELKGIRLSTRPDYIDRDIISFLESYPVTSVELGVQSMDPEVLLRSKRNHTVEDVYAAAKRIRDAGISLGVQMMVGLPGDDGGTLRKTAKRLIGLQPDTVRIYPTLVIKGTELERLYQDGRYQPLTVEEAVEEVADILPLFVEKGIVVLRVGLQANDGLNSDDLVAGPYHPAFKELVQDRIIYDRIISSPEFIRASKDSGNPGIELKANQKLYNRLIGHRKQNMMRFSELGCIMTCDPALREESVEILTIHGRSVLSCVL